MDCLDRGPQTVNNGQQFDAVHSRHLSLNSSFLFVQRYNNVHKRP